MSDSNSTTSADQHYTDNRNVLGQDANLATNGSSITNTTNTTTNNTVLDGGSIDMAGRVALGAFDSANGQLKDSYKFGTSALNFGSDVVGGALSSVNGALTKALNFGQDSLSLANSAMTSSQQSANSALNFGSGALGSALAYGRAETSAALDSLNTGASMVATAYADAKGRGALTDKMIMLAVAAMAVVAYAALRKGHA